MYLLGPVTLEQLSLAPDPVEKKLKQVEALLMSTFKLKNIFNKEFNEKIDVLVY